MVMEASRNKWNIIVFFLAIIVFLIDYFVFGFQRDNSSNLGTIFLMYFLLCIVYFIVELSGTETRTIKTSLKQLGIALLLSILQIAIPYLLLQYVISSMSPMFSGVIFFILGIMCAPWVIYFLFINPPDSKFTSRVRVVWFIILILITLVYIAPILFMGAENLTGTGSIINTDSLTLTPGDAFRELSNTIKERLSDTQHYINQTINAKLRPEDAKSKIDKNSQARLGVFISDLRLMINTVVVGEPFEMIGVMEVNTIFDQIEIKTNCFIETTTNSDVKVQGTQTESEFFVLGQDSRILDCQYPAMTAGRYNAYFESNFKFETWAYLEYTFVNKELVLDFIREGRDINRDLDIKKEYNPIFTDGPVQIRMIAANQPISVDLEGNNALPKFGIYLNRYWRKGEISSVERIVVQMPKMINLTDCTPANYNPQESDTHPDSDQKSDYFHYYVFTNPEKIPGALESFTCSMNIDKTMYQQEKQLNQKLEKTIVVSAVYDYKSESSKELVRVIEPRI